MAWNAIIEKNWNGSEVKVHGQKAIGKTMIELALQVEGQAKLLCAIDTGLLAGSITVQMRGGFFTRGFSTAPETPATQSDTIKAPREKNEAHIGTAVFYGPYIEFGTINMDAQPFLRPALDLAKGKTLTMIKKNGRMEFAEYLR